MQCMQDHLCWRSIRVCHQCSHHFQNHNEPTKEA
ncbi:UNVERIFIED_CONTAM: hypothetical protein GTU68_055291 [Idotea baltica]|nr:hypothetical protein [Idotea baltica]